MAKQTDGIRLVDDMQHDFNGGRQELEFFKEFLEKDPARAWDHYQNAMSVFANHEWDLRCLSLRKGDGVKV